MLIWDTFIIVTGFKFGKLEQTKLNQVPFNVMLIGLTLSSVELLILLIGEDKLALFSGSFTPDIFINCSDYKEFFWFNDVLWINRVFKVFFLDVFVLVFAYELLALLKFVIF